MLLMSVPLWITEIAPPEGRGVLASIHGVAATCGYVLASYTGVGFYYLNGHGNQWRGPLALACLFPIITLCLLPLLPESPRYLLAKGREDEAWGIIQRLHRTRDDPDSLYARKEFVQLQKQYDLDSSLDSSWKILLTRPSYRRRVLIAGSVLPFLYSSGTLSISSETNPELARHITILIQTCRLRTIALCRAGLRYCSDTAVSGRYRSSRSNINIGLNAHRRSGAKECYARRRHVGRSCASNRGDNCDCPFPRNRQQRRSGGRSGIPVYLYFRIWHIP